MYRASALTRIQIREYANLFRKKLGLENRLKIPIVNVLEIIHFIDKDAYFEIVETE